VGLIYREKEARCFRGKKGRNVSANEAEPPGGAKIGLCRHFIAQDFRK